MADHQLCAEPEGGSCRYIAAVFSFARKCLVYSRRLLASDARRRTASAEAVVVGTAVVVVTASMFVAEAALGAYKSMTVELGCDGGVNTLAFVSRA